MNLKSHLLHLLSVLIVVIATILVAPRMTLALDGAGDGENPSIQAESASTSKTVRFDISKTWDDTGHTDSRPSSITANVYGADGTTIVATVTLSADNNWSASTSELPYLDSDGNRISYTVSEGTVPSNYSSSVSSVTNKTNADMELWVLADSITDGATYVLVDAHRGDGQLLRAEGPTENVLSGTQHIFSNDVTAGGNTYSTYTYLASSDTVTVANSLGWTAHVVDGKVYLSSNMEATDASLNRTEYLANDKGTWKITGTQQENAAFSFDATTGTVTIDGRVLYLYRYQAQDEQPNYITKTTITNTYTGSSSGGDSGINVSDGKLTITASKTWSDDNDAAGKRPASVVVDLLANGTATGKTVTLTADNNWTATFEGLDYEDVSGNKITYTLSEENVDGYTSSITYGDVTSSTVSYWIPVSTLGTSAADNATYLIVARENSTSGGTGVTNYHGLYWSGSGEANWTTSPYVSVNTTSITINGTSYSSWVTDDIAAANTESQWNSHYYGTYDAGGQTGTYPWFTLENYAHGSYLKFNGQGDMNTSGNAQECRLHYGIVAQSGVKYTLSNPTDDWPYVLANCKHYYLLQNNHTGDGNAEQSNTFLIYKRVSVTSYAQADSITNTYTPTIPTGSVTINKKDSDGQVLSGAGFTIYSTDSSLGGTPVTYDGVNYYQLASQTSGTDGVVKFDSLRADGTFKYVLVETTVPDGYKAVDPIFVQLPLTSGGSTFTDLTYTAIDYKKVVLPGTGGVGVLPYAFVGIGALALMPFLLNVIGEGGEGEKGKER